MPCACHVYDMCMLSLVHMQVHSVVQTQWCYCIGLHMWLCLGYDVERGRGSTTYGMTLLFTLHTDWVHGQWTKIITNHAITFSTANFNEWNIHMLYTVGLWTGVCKNKSSYINLFAAIFCVHTMLPAITYDTLGIILYQPTMQLLFMNLCTYERYHTKL